MKKNFLFIATILLLIGACKKEARELQTNQSPTSTTGELSPSPNLSICTGNNWSLDQQFNGKSYAPTLVYNNKLQNNPNNILMRKYTPLICPQF
jgi:hypothetical protein